MIPGIQLNKIEGQTFVGANVQLDGGSAYIKCNFVGCTLIFTGAGPLHLDANNFDPACKWQFAGPAANTFSFLKLLYAGGGKEMVENLFREIRGERPRPALVPNPGQKSGGVLQ